jgi:hypothetical protein
MMALFTGKRCCNLSTLGVGVAQKYTQFTHTPQIDTKKTYPHQQVNMLPDVTITYRDSQIPNINRQRRNYVHHIVYTDLNFKTPSQSALEERVQSLFNENCDPDLREFIIRDLVRMVTGVDQEDQQLASDLLLRLSTDLRLAIPAVNREYLLASVVELNLIENDPITANRIAFETSPCTIGDWR